MNSDLNLIDWRQENTVLRAEVSPTDKKSPRKHTKNEKNCTTKTDVLELMWRGWEIQWIWASRGIKQFQGHLPNFAPMWRLRLPSSTWCHCEIPTPLACILAGGGSKMKFTFFLGGRSPLKCKLTYPKVSDFIFFRGRAPPPKKMKYRTLKVSKLHFLHPSPPPLGKFLWQKELGIVIWFWGMNLRKLFAFTAYSCKGLLINHPKNVSYIFGPPPKISLNDLKKCNLQKFRSKAEKCNLHF